MSEPKKKSLQEIVAEEYKKCAASPVYFMKNYVKIQHQMKGTIKFDLFPLNGTFSSISNFYCIYTLQIICSSKCKISIQLLIEKFIEV